MAFSNSVSLLLPNDTAYLNLTLYAVLFDESGNTVDTITTGFTEYGKGNYTLVYDNFPDDFHGTLAFYNSLTDDFLASTEINAPPNIELSVSPLFYSQSDVKREKSIYITKGDTIRLVYANSFFSNDNITEIVFVIKFDMVDSDEDAMLIVSLTNGCEIVLGEPVLDASLATLYYDEHFVYCLLKAELTDLFSSVKGTQKYKVTVSDNTGVHTISYGNCKVTL